MTTGPAGHRHRPNDAADPTHWHEYPLALAPDRIKLVQELIVIFDPAKLAAIRVGGILLQVEVRRRGNNEVERLVGNRRQIRRVAPAEDMPGLVVRLKPWAQPELAVDSAEQVGAPGPLSEAGSLGEEVAVGFLREELANKGMSGNLNVHAATIPERKLDGEIEIAGR